MVGVTGSSPVLPTSLTSSISSEPSFFGGLILNYRIQPEGKFEGMVIFTFEYRADHRGFVAENEGWSRDMKVVMRE